MRLFKDKVTNCKILSFSCNSAFNAGYVYLNIRNSRKKITHIAVQIWYREDEIMMQKNVILRIPTNKLYEAREMKKNYKNRN